MKFLRGPARAGIVAAELLGEFLVSVNDVEFAFDVCFGWESLSALTRALEKRSRRLRCECALPYSLLGR